MTRVIEPITIERLGAQALLEPDMRDVFVEGSFDHRFVRFFFQQTGNGHVRVDTVDVVEVPNDAREALGLPNNNRGKLMAVAELLAAVVPSSNLVFTCIADADFDLILRKTRGHPPLLFTDFACMELYLLDPVIIQRFLDLVVGCPEISAEEVFARISGVLQDLFIIRLTNEEMKLGLRWQKVEKCCSLRAGIVEFN